MVLYRNQIDDLQDTIQQGYNVKADLRLHEAVIDNPNLTSEQVSQLLDEIYQLRNDSLKTEGEYGLGNLVFKELRGLGYLDRLKELKRYLEGQELSVVASPLKEGIGSFDFRQAVLENPQVLEGEVLDMQEADPDRYYYDEANNPQDWDLKKFRNLCQDLRKRLITEFDMTPEEAQTSVEAYLGKEENLKNAK